MGVIFMARRPLRMDLLHLFHAGGFMMYPLLIASIIVVAIFIERFKYYHSAKSDMDKLSKEIPEYLANHDMEGLKAALKRTARANRFGMCSAKEKVRLKTEIQETPHATITIY